jgi:tetratricopeptide (TPR) repeat protein
MSPTKIANNFPATKLAILQEMSESQQKKLLLFWKKRFEKDDLKNDCKADNDNKFSLEQIIEQQNFFNILGDFYFKERELKQAFHYYQIALNENPDDYWTNLHVATIYQKYLIDRQILDIDLKRKDIIERIIDIYNRQLLKNPDDRKCLRLLGKFYGHIGQFDRAIPINRRLAELIQDRSSNLSPTQASDSSKNTLRFLVLGSMKSGTTTLFEAIGSHPDFVKPIVKEIQFFALFLERGYDWYFSHFPQRNRPYFTGESSTSSFDYLHVPERIKNSDLDLKFLIILREPISRIISNFFHLKAHYNLKVNTDLDATISEQLDILESYRESLIDMAAGKIAIDPTLPIFQDYNRFFIMRSLYPIFIRNWYNFFPKEKIAILRMQDFTEKPKIHLRKIYKFLEVSVPETISYKPHRANAGKIKATPLSPQIQERLANFLQPFNRILKEDFQLDFNG